MIGSIVRGAWVRARVVGLVAAVIAGAAPAATDAQAFGKPMRVLFIGNSYTYFNNLAITIADFAMANRDSRIFVPTVVLVGGSTLEAHLGRGEAQKELAKGGWDFVVLQDQSTRPLTAPEATWRDAQAIAALAPKGGASIVMYETWAREAAPQLQDSLSRAYHRAAELARGRVAHVGDAWAKFRATETVVPPAHSALFFTDGAHPSKAGTYLAACVIYATLYEKTPEGLPPLVRATMEQPPVGLAPTDTPRDSIAAPLAVTLQKLAWATVKP